MHDQLQGFDPNHNTNGSKLFHKLSTGFCFLYINDKFQKKNIVAYKPNILTSICSRCMLQKHTFIISCIFLRISPKFKTTGSCDVVSSSSSSLSSLISSSSLSSSSSSSSSFSSSFSVSKTSDSSFKAFIFFKNASTLRSMT